MRGRLVLLQYNIILFHTKATNLREHSSIALSECIFYYVGGY